MLTYLHSDPTERVFIILPARLLHLPHIPLFVVTHQHIRGVRVKHLLESVKQHVREEQDKGENDE